MTALAVGSKVGTDMGRFPTDEHFAPWLGAYVRRLCARMDKPKAVTAAAHKLARLSFSMLTKVEEYTDQGQACCEERYRQRALHHLTRRAQQLGMTLVQTAPAALAA